MSQSSILVTSATGNQGQGVVFQCLATTSYKVYALVRDPSSTKSQSLASAGAILVKGDLDGPVSIKSALEQRQPTVVFLNLPPGPGEQQLTQARTVIAAAKAAASVQSLISSSASGTGTHESFPNWGPDHPMYGYWRAKHEIEDLVRGAGFRSWTIIRLGFFLQLFVPPVSDLMFPDLWGSAGAERVIRTAFKPETRLDVLDGGDIGAVVAAALLRPDDFRYRVVGLAAESVTASELAEKMGKARGEKIEVVYYSAGDLAVKLGPMGTRLVAAQELFNDIGASIDVRKNREEFNMTSIEEFFAKAKVSNRRQNE
ncbi:hypothetical protein SCAR479_13830 [Seiridium cardinale]|uniref:NmrA-like domain-containing protein n=1 Tax=Seiridium cardinale TaxID=138064 RepID=A0ABR2X6W2_9PEZI